MNIVDYTQKGLGNIESQKKIIVKVSAMLFSTFQVPIAEIEGNYKKTIPFILEPKLLDDIDNLHFFISKTNDFFNVVVIKEKILQDLRDVIQENKLDVLGVYPEFMFLPYNSEKTTYMQEGNTVIFRDGIKSGGCLHKDLFFNIFDKETVVVVDNFSKDYRIFNLLTYDFNKIWANIIKPYIGALILFIIAFTLHTIMIALDTKQKLVTISELQNYNTKLFKDMFPNEEHIVDVKLQAEQKMQNLSKQKELSDNDFLSALLDKKIVKPVKSLVFTDENAVLEVGYE